MRKEEGAGTVLALALVAAVIAAFLLAAAAAIVLDGHRRVVAAADASALGAADVALGNATGVPCERATALAAGAGVLLDRCTLRGTLVRVHASTVVLGVALGADAVAGPPPAR